MTTHFKAFPFEEIRREDGNYFDSWQEASDAGYADDQIWSVCEDDNVWTYGPPHHRVNHVGHIATKERHDGDTYYEETVVMDYADVTCCNCGSKTDESESPDGEVCPDCWDKEAYVE